MLLDRGRRHFVGKLFDVSGHMHRLDAAERTVIIPSRQRRNTAAARAYAARVFLLRMLTVKNSTKRCAARSPALPIKTGSSAPACSQ